MASSASGTAETLDPIRRPPRTFRRGPLGRLLGGWPAPGLGLEDLTARIWDLATGEARAVLRGHTDIVRAVAFSPDGRRLASIGRDPVARIWDAGTGMLVTTLRGHAAGIHSLAYRPDGKVVATGGDFPDSTVRLWDAESGVPLSTSPGHENEVRWLAFSPDGSRIASASMDQTVRLWDRIRRPADPGVAGALGPRQSGRLQPRRPSAGLVVG